MFATKKKMFSPALRISVWYNLSSRSNSEKAPSEFSIKGYAAQLKQGLPHNKQLLWTSTLNICSVKVNSHYWTCSQYPQSGLLSKSLMVWLYQCYWSQWPNWDHSAAATWGPHNPSKAQISPVISLFENPSVAPFMPRTSSQPLILKNIFLVRLTHLLP